MLINHNISFATYFFLQHVRYLPLCKYQYTNKLVGVYVNYYNKFYSLLKRKIWHCHLWRGFKYAKNKVTNYIIKTYSRWAYISRETNFAMDVSEKIMFTGMINPLLLSPQCTYIIQFKRIKMSIRSWTWCVLTKYNQTNICSIWLRNIASRIQ
jgi:hypothetical protein